MSFMSVCFHLFFILFIILKGANTSNLERLDQLPEDERYNGLTNVSIKLKPLNQIYCMSLYMNTVYITVLRSYVIQASFLMLYVCVCACVYVVVQLQITDLDHVDKRVM